MYNPTQQVGSTMYETTLAVFDNEKQFEMFFFLRFSLILYPPGT